MRRMRLFHQFHRRNEVPPKLPLVQLQIEMSTLQFFVFFQDKIDSSRQESSQKRRYPSFARAWKSIIRIKMFPLVFKLLFNHIFLPKAASISPKDDLVPDTTAWSGT